MKKFILLISLIIIAQTAAQTPYYKIEFSVYDGQGSGFETTSQSCDFDYKPFIKSGDYWFGKDTSALDWNNLPDSLYSRLECKGNAPVKGDKFTEGIQSMIWERIFSFTIVRNRKASPADTMIMVFPVLVKSFVTYINLGKIEFKPGYFELTDNLIYNTNDNLVVTLPENFKWEAAEFERRKIKINNK
jgi:hypothetical protein